MIYATLAIVEHGDDVLLGERLKDGERTGIIVAPGGKVRVGETYVHCVIREIEEETCAKIDIASIQIAANITFYANNRPDYRVRVFRVRATSRIIQPSKEMIPRWYAKDRAPYKRGFPSDIHWFPKLVEGASFDARVYYKERMKGFISIDFLPFSSPR